MKDGTNRQYVSTWKMIRGDCNNRVKYNRNYSQNNYSINKNSKKDLIFLGVTMQKSKISKKKTPKRGIEPRSSA